MMCIIGKIIFNCDEQDEVFDSEAAAEEYAQYLCSCTHVGAEIMELSNPGDFDGEDDTDYEIIKVN